MTFTARIAAQQGKARERRMARRRGLDRLWGGISFALTLLPLALLVGIAAGLVVRTWPILATVSPLDLITGRVWQPLKGAFGFYPFIMGTAWVTVLAMLLAVPPSLLVAIYLSVYARPLLKNLMKPVLDVLAGIPSVVYGVWGLIAIVPFVQNVAAPVLRAVFPGIPLFNSQNPTGFSILAGSLVLSVMVAPVMIAVSYEVLQTAPQGLREATLAMGATRWQMVKHVVLRRCAPGIAAAVVLGFSRAFGETMAVLMVVGNVPKAPASILDPAYPLPALIANNYGEMMSIPMYDAALMGAALVLLVVVLLFNIVSTAILRRVSGRTV